MDGCQVTWLTAGTAYVVSGMAYTENLEATTRSSVASFTTTAWP